MKFYLAGQWQDRDEVIEVLNPFRGEVIDTVPKATAEDVETAIASAVEGAKVMAAMQPYERYLMLRKAADMLREREAELGAIISQEEGKPLHEGRGEIGRSAQTLELSGEEAKRLGGEVLPLEGGEGVTNKLGFTLRVPCGVVAAITPFNFPLNLVCHKVGPALAAGNSILLKPASDTPLIALKLVEILLECGMPPLAMSCITGSGAVVGDLICKDERVRKISFTGSKEVGEHICSIAGIKRVTMELGSNSPLIVMPDADMDKVKQATLACGYANAGQVCISAQRLIVLDEVHDELVHSLQQGVAGITVGDQLAEGTKVGPMVRERDAVRVAEWIDEAVSQGAELLQGGERDGAVVTPALLANTNRTMKIVHDEIFGPAVAILRAANIDEAIEMANDTDYGLSAGVFTQDVDAAIQFARRVHSGNVHINWGPMWRTDGMPYGGLKFSGIGKEGPKYAIEEMTEMKSIVMHS